MFGIELDLVKKLEIGFCVVVLGLATFFILNGTRKPEDNTVTAWMETYVVTKNGLGRETPTDPEDPVRTYTKTIFKIPDGQLEFKEYPKRITVNPDDKTRAEIVFRHVARDDKDKYDCFPPLMRLVMEYKDPSKRAVAMACVASIFYEQNHGLVSRLGLSNTDLRDAAAKFDELKKAVKLVDDDVSSGIVESNQYEKVMAAYTKFRSYKSFDAKAMPELLVEAKNVMTIGMPYAKLVQDKKQALVDEYADFIVSKLNDSQKATAVKVGDEILKEFEKVQHANAGRRAIGN